MRLKEADLYPPLKAWLEAKGYRVVAEVPMVFRTIDVIAVKDGHVIAVEMKLCMTEGVLHQGVTAKLCSDSCYVAVGSRPRSLEKAKQWGLGVLSIRDGKVEVLLEPGKNKETRVYYRDMAIEKAKHMPTDTVGGVPCLEGVGPARDCKRRVEDYKKENPKATWKEIYANVPNHYASAKSMSNALGYSMRQRDAWKERRKKQREGR